MRNVLVGITDQSENRTFGDGDQSFKILSPGQTDLGGFHVRRLLPHRQCRMVGPWIFFDHMGPADFSPGQGVNVRPHPHINLATVTYLFEGEIWHRDSLGTSLPIRPGALNLMVAGKGVVHSERTSDDLLKVGQRLHGLQLWLALPDDLEEIDPSFHHYAEAEIPFGDQGGVPVRVLIGEAFGLRSPVRTFGETLYFEARLSEGQTLTLPSSPEIAVYMVKGRSEVGSHELKEFEMGVFNGQIAADVTAKEQCLIAVIGGASVGPRFMDWNFVSSRRERIQQAIELWQNQGFDLIPEDDQEFIPFPRR